MSPVAHLGVLDGLGSSVNVDYRKLSLSKLLIFGFSKYCFFELISEGSAGLSNRER